MRPSFAIALLFSILAGSVYWYQTEANVCPAPIYYRVGELNESFSISYEEAVYFALEAEKIWEEKSGRELFIYDEKSEFTIDYIFDERQAEANQEELWRIELDNKRAENEKVLKLVESLQLEYESLLNNYKNKTEVYEANLTEYNQKVKKYNDRGGAPSDIYKELEEERLDLEREANELNQTSNNLNKLVSDINELSERGNKLVADYNEEVNRYNEEFGYKREFTQGDYQGGKIHIYKFSSENELIKVLVHEFGHALGIDHVEDESSVMYYLMEDIQSEPVLSDYDFEAYLDVCGEEESFSQGLRRNIREFLTKYF